MLRVNGSEILLVLVYIHPERQPPEEWNSLLDSPLSTLLAGNFNAKHSCWNIPICNNYYLLREETLAFLHSNRQEHSKHHHYICSTDLSSDHDSLLITVWVLSDSLDSPVVLLRESTGALIMTNFPGSYHHFRRLQLVLVTSRNPELLISRK